MRILAIENEIPGVTSEQFQPLLKTEAARLWELYQAGIVRELYFRQDRSAAVLILECADGQAAAGILSSLPLVQQHLIAFEVIPLEPYPGFARLFESRAR